MLCLLLMPIIWASVCTHGANWQNTKVESNEKNIMDAKPMLRIITCAAVSHHHRQSMVHYSSKERERMKTNKSHKQIVLVTIPVRLALLQSGRLTDCPDSATASVVPSEMKKRPKLPVMPSNTNSREKRICTIRVFSLYSFSTCYQIMAGLTL